MSENYSKLMTMKEARSFLPVSNTTIRRWVDEGKLPAYKTEGGHRKFFKEDLLSRLFVQRTKPCNIQLSISL